MKPNIKFGDILEFSDEWYAASGEKPKKKRFVATGKIGGEEPDWLVYVAGEGKSYIHSFHHTFLVGAKRRRLFG